VLTQTVPDAVKNDAVREMEMYLGTMIRQVDSSLLDEWEKMRDPNYQRTETKEARPPGAEEADQGRYAGCGRHLRQTFGPNFYLSARFDHW